MVNLDSCKKRAPKHKYFKSNGELVISTWKLCSVTLVTWSPFWEGCFHAPLHSLFVPHRSFSKFFSTKVANECQIPYANFINEVLTVCKLKIIIKIIINRGDWLWSPANIKDAKIYVRRSTTVHNLLFCAHTLCLNYVTNTFLLVSSLERTKQLLCFLRGQGQKSEQKHTTKNFVGFHNHSPLLTMWK